MISRDHALIAPRGRLRAISEGDFDATDLEAI
jgi:hypothetical protein